MYDFYDDDYYYKLNEFEEKMDELKESLILSVKDEIKQRIESLEKENQKLQEIKNNWEKLKQEYHNKQLELQNKIDNAEREAKKARLNELFKASGMNVVLYKVNYNLVYKPKCNRCDNNREIHFKSPSGKDYYEKCDCAKQYKKYKPKEFEIVNFRIDNSKNSLLMWFVPRANGDEYEFYNSSRVDNMYNGEPFEELQESNVLFMFFKTEEECQAYCDYLNEKNGITEEMI